MLGTNDIAITIGMEPTACLKVQVTDDKGNPLKDVQVETWPNVLYGEWGAVILMGDCYNSSDQFLLKGIMKDRWWQPFLDFQGVSDSAGVAVIPNLPADVKELGVDHPRFALPAMVTPGGDNRRQASFALVPGQSNHVSIRLEPREQSPIRHY